MTRGNKAIKVIVLSALPLPYPNIGSWTTMYANYIATDHQIDAIVCPKPDLPYPKIEYQYVRKDFLARFRRRYSLFPFRQYFVPLSRLLRQDGKYVIQIVDNSGIVVALDRFLRKKSWRDRCHIQYFNHGFPPPFSDNNPEFYRAVDELVVLTHDSLEVHKAYVPDLSRLKVMHNGIDTRKFYAVDPDTKQQLRESHGYKARHIFVWCSQDRPKKGLDIALKAWDAVYDPGKDIQLVVVGTAGRPPQAGVDFVGKVENDKLPPYFQLADVYLFPTQCDEGFGMSLIEALHCGCYCMASARGGVPEVLQYGQLGYLVQHPQQEAAWIAAIDLYLRGAIQRTEWPDGLYSSGKWNDNMNMLLTRAKEKLQP